MYHVKVLKAADAEAAGRLAADQLQQAVCAKPACVLGLATGYRRHRRRCRCCCCCYRSDCRSRPAEPAP